MSWYLQSEERCFGVGLSAVLPIISKLLGRSSVWRIMIKNDKMSDSSIHWEVCC